MAKHLHSLEPALDASGYNASPQLPDGVKNYLIDIDGTIEDVPNETRADGDLVPFLDALETLNKWYEGGHIITFYVQNGGASRCHGSVVEATGTIPRHVDLERQLPLGGQPHRASDEVRGTVYRFG